MLLGLAVASVQPRAGRSASLVLALFSFIVYYNLMTLGQSWIAVGRSTSGHFCYNCTAVRWYAPPSR